MIGSVGPRMLRITLPHVQAWNAWYESHGNTPDGLAPLTALVDGACRDVGRDPAEVERTVAVLVSLPGATGARDADHGSSPPLEGPPDRIADVLRRFAGMGIAHVQLIIDPISAAGIGALAPVLEALDHGG